MYALITMWVHAWNLTAYIYAPSFLKLDLKLQVVSGLVADGDARDIFVAKLVNPAKGLCQ